MESHLEYLQKEEKKKTKEIVDCWIDFLFQFSNTDYCFFFVASLSSLLSSETRKKKHWKSLKFAICFYLNLIIIRFRFLPFILKLCKQRNHVESMRWLSNKKRMRKREREKKCFKCASQYRHYQTSEYLLIGRNSPKHGKVRKRK